MRRLISLTTAAVALVAAAGLGAVWVRPEGGWMPCAVSSRPLKAWPCVAG